MKIEYQAANGIKVVLEGDSDKKLFEELANFQNGPFNQSTCGKCKSNDVRFVTRNDKEDNTYYSIRCNKCFAYVECGVHKGKDEKLFVKLFEKEGGGVRGTNGWIRWDKDRQVAD